MSDHLTGIVANATNGTLSRVAVRESDLDRDNDEHAFMQEHTALLARLRPSPELEAKLRAGDRLLPHEIAACVQFTTLAMLGARQTNGGAR